MPVQIYYFFVGNSTLNITRSVNISASTKLHLREGDILDCTAEVLVNSSDPKLSHVRGLAKIIVQKGT